MAVCGVLMSSTTAVRISSAWSRSSASVISAPDGISVLAKMANSLMISSWCSRMNALSDMLCSPDRRARWQEMEPTSNLSRSHGHNRIAGASANGAAPSEARSRRYGRREIPVAPFLDPIHICGRSRVEDGRAPINVQCARPSSGWLRVAHFPTCHGPANGQTNRETTPLAGSVTCDRDMAAMELR